MHGLLRVIGTVQIHSGDSSDPVRQAPQHVPRPSDRRPDLGRLHPYLFTNRSRRQLHRAPVGAGSKFDHKAPFASFHSDTSGALKTRMEF